MGSDYMKLHNMMYKNKGDDILTDMTGNDLRLEHMKLFERWRDVR